MENECETCWHYDYDEEYEEYYCKMDLDEDEVYRLYANPKPIAPTIGGVTIIPLQGDSK